jgi:hypothetical protein
MNNFKEASACLVSFGLGVLTLCGVVVWISRKKAFLCEKCGSELTYHERKRLGL